MDGQTDIFSIPPYTLDQARKSAKLLPLLNALTKTHRDRCEKYRRALDLLYLNGTSAGQWSEVPYLPVKLFKVFDLKSITDAEVFKVLHSSGTSSGTSSRIYLNREAADLQRLALTSTLKHLLGEQRRPMLVVDTRSILTDPRNLSARAAGVLGLINFGADPFFILDHELSSDPEPLKKWLHKHAKQDLVIFGFTFMVWQHLLQELGVLGLDLSRATLIHSGGWKKLTELSVSNQQFKTELRKAFGIRRVHNFYGMVEQIGSIFLECEKGNIHTPNYSEVVIRDPTDWTEAANGSEGIIQVLSVLPESYPGHSILTEDVGVVKGADNCICGAKGKVFSIQGRVPQAELRGCSDTYALRTVA